MNGLRSNITARIGFPETAPVEGYYASIACLHQHGFLRDGGDYSHALSKAGFTVVMTDDGPFLDVCAVPRGFFAEGVGPSAEEMFSALASEGFEGSVTDAATRRSWYLSGGRSIPVRDDFRMCA
ncbi:hypothetical protein GOB57_25060 [Sinorhizobium meliloti]|nr:hypothetical protein [Sinorhizobium meliloti]